MKPSAFFARHPVFRFDEFKAAHQAGGTRSPETTGSVLKQHVAAGNLINVRRGLYARVPDGAVARPALAPGVRPLTRVWRSSKPGGPAPRPPARAPERPLRAARPAHCVLRRHGTRAAGG